jgi:hypothetical protein
MGAYLVQRLPLVIPTVRGVTLVAMMVAMARVAIPEFCLSVWRFPSPCGQVPCVGTGGVRRSLRT